MTASPTRPPALTSRPALRPPDEPDYDVGYGKPPAEHRFQKGRSGNPRGRPKGSKNKRPALHEDRLRGIILDEAYRGIDIREGDRTLTVPMAQAVMRAIAHNAVKGKHFSQKLFAELVGSTEAANLALSNKVFESAANYKFEWEVELDLRRKHGITDLREPLPHPDHVILDMTTGTVRIAGPFTKEEKRMYEEAAELWASCHEQLPGFDAYVRRTRAKDRYETAQKVAIIRKTYEALDKTLPQDMKDAAVQRLEAARAEEEGEE